MERFIIERSAIEHNRIFDYRQSAIEEVKSEHNRTEFSSIAFDFVRLVRFVR